MAFHGAWRVACVTLVALVSLASCLLVGAYFEEDTAGLLDALRLRQGPANTTSVADPTDAEVPASQNSKPPGLSISKKQTSEIKIQTPKNQLLKALLRKQSHGSTLDKVQLETRNLSMHNLPNASNFELRTQNRSSGPALPSALCIVGNIRTFPLVYSSIERFAKQNALHVYMVLQLGETKGSTWLKYEADYFGAKTEEVITTKLTQEAENRSSRQSMDIRRVAVVRYGGCKEYLSKFAKTQKMLPHKDCKETPSHSQIVWTRTCFEMVLQSKIVYDHIVRIRPDVGFFGDLKLAKYRRKMLHAGLRREEPPTAGDWLYFLDYSNLKSWWARVEKQAAANSDQWPYPDFFLFRGVQMQRHHFPAVIVRSSSMAECCRGLEEEGVQDAKAGKRLAKECSDALKQKAFSNFTPFFGLPTPTKHGPLRTCNIDRR
ncbi:unnamed protein product [Polarella glacialis]|uniref:Protein xylosyltransferase n=1 Tax=Polarella glacialis TaxID=89957 RepID=A0A813EXQ0_POLGL|nr:unnamed protein product [Polarella glacialis]